MIPAAPALRLALFATTAVAAGAAGWATSQAAKPHLAFDQPLARYAAERPKVRKLPDGGRIAVGSRNGHDITVQWRGPGAAAWSAPQRVQRQARFWTHDMSVKQAAGTIAIAPDFWRERILDDDYAPAFTTLTVCRDYVCEGSRRARELSGATIADRGRLVAFGFDERHLLRWEDGRGYRTPAITGMPMGDRRVRVMPDGTFIGVIGRWDGEQCHYVLYTAGRGSTSFRKEVETPGFYDHKPCLLASAHVAGRNRVDVWIEIFDQDVSFRRTGSEWTVDKRALTRLQIKDTHGTSTLAVQPVRIGRKTALIGSRDRRHILVQFQRRPRAAWSETRVIAEAPAGTVCRNSSSAWGEGTRPIAMVLVHCYREKRKVKIIDEPSDVALVLATTNGRRWAIGTVERPGWEPLVSRRHLMAVGSASSLLYGGGRTFQTVRLPVNTRWDGISLTLDGKRLARIPGNADANASCTAMVTIAPVSATAWPSPTAFAADGFPRPGTCSGSIFEDAPGSFTAGVYQMDWSWEGGFTLNDGRLRVNPPLE